MRTGLRIDNEEEYPDADPEETLIAIYRKDVNKGIWEGANKGTDRGTLNLEGSI